MKRTWWLVGLCLWNLSHASDSESDPMRDLESGSVESRITLAESPQELSPGSNLHSLAQFLGQIELESFRVMVPAGPTLESPRDLTSEVIHNLIFLASDGMSIGSSVLLLATRFSDNPQFFPISAGVAAGSAAIEFFRGFDQTLDAWWHRPRSIDSILAAGQAVTQATWVAGLTLLASAEVVPLIYPAWVLTTAEGARVALMGTSLATRGLNETFGSPHTITNGIFRLGLLGIISPIGGILLGVGIIAGHWEITEIGMYVLGFASIPGVMEVMARDMQNLVDLAHQLQARHAP